MQIATMRLKTRIGLCFATLGLLCVMVGMLGIKGIADANARADAFYVQVALPTQYLQNAFRLQSVQAIQLFEAMSIDNVTARKDRFDVIDTLDEPVERQFELFRRSRKPPAVQALVAEFIRNREQLKKGFAEAVRLGRSDNMGKATTVMAEQVRPYALSMGREIDMLSDSLGKAADDARQRDDAAYRQTKELIAGLLILGGVALLVHVWREMRLLGRSLQKLQASLDDTSRTLDLTCQAPVERMDEIGRTALAFNELISRFSEAIRAVIVAMENVGIATRQIAENNAELSIRTVEQAESLEEVAASTTQLAESVRQGADNAMHARQLATSAVRIAEQGDAAVESMVQTIGAINQRSIRISEITGLIEGIAFQTNILALNAAVEAARAGEQGRGFAVVAGEVRALAHRSSSAAREIKELIESSAAIFTQSAKQACHVSGTITEVKDAIDKVSQIVAEIADASVQQKLGIQQVNQALMQMEILTQRYAAVVEQVTAAARSLDEQAAKLDVAICVFAVGDSIRG
ncbi:methyl-accepting chemotaxis protein [Paraburkholderia hospita]|nr:methyl-accepting chemotaxis protein [Paraburkholderia hospita]SEI17817.1 methyl-accepting chemotaxis protein [Paraburkholderia hospita]